MKRNVKDKYITRLDWGFWVRFYIGCNGRNKKGDRIGQPYKMQAGKTFGFNEHGGIRKAQAAAREWRDKMEKKLRAPVPEDKIRFCRRTNNTGVLGVHIKEYLRVRENGMFWDCRVTANWSEPNPNGPRAENYRKSKGFWYKKDDEIGKRNALRLAKAHRKRMEKRYYYND